MPIVIIPDLVTTRSSFLSSMRWTRWIIAPSQRDTSCMQACNSMVCVRVYLTTSLFPFSNILCVFRIVSSVMRAFIHIHPLTLPRVEFFKLQSICLFCVRSARLYARASIWIKQSCRRARRDFSMFYTTSNMHSIHAARQHIVYRRSPKAVKIILCERSWRECLKNVFSWNSYYITVDRWNCGLQ